MSHPPTSSTRAAKKIYRFALYGRRNSGKTCLLAALAMERTAHPEGLSCTWLAEDPKDDWLNSRGNTGENANEVLTTFRRGREWLELAIRNLEEGSVPPPNPNDSDVLRLRYEFTVADHRTFSVELIDYSGELIEPDLSDSELAQRLRRRMLTMDGILVLAEAPHPGQPVGELYEPGTAAERSKRR